MCFVCVWQLLDQLKHVSALHYSRAHLCSAVGKCFLLFLFLSLVYLTHNLWFFYPSAMCSQQSSNALESKCCVFFCCLAAGPVWSPVISYTFTKKHNTYTIKIEDWTEKLKWWWTSNRYENPAKVFFLLFST